MRMKLLKVAVVLLLSASGEARPQRSEGSSQALPSKASPAEWRTLGVPQTVREDSRYTWNSGSSTIPYTNPSRGNIDPFLERHGQVNVDKTVTQRSTAIQRSRSNGFKYSSKIPQKSSGKPIDRASITSNQWISNSFRGQSTRTQSSNNLAGRRNVLRRHSTVQTSKGAIPGSVRRNSTNLSLKNSGQRLNVGYAPVSLLDSSVSHPKRVKLNSTKGGPLRDSIRDVPFGSTDEILMNNSPSNGAALGQNSVFSREKEGSWSIPGGTTVKVESTTPFDHVAAIKKITNMLSREQPVRKLPSEAKNSVEDGVASTRPSLNPSNRNWSSKHSNRTKIRRPSPSHHHHHQKKNQSKVHSNKNHVHKNNSSKPDMNLKNWPNGAIQNADDFHNYDKYTSTGDDLKPDEAAQQPVPLKNSTLHYQVPISRPSLQEIVHWLKIPAFMTNGSHVIESEQIDGPISVAFDPVYQNLEPNEPAKPSNPQNPKPGFVYPPYSPGYNAEKIPSWLETVLLRNKTHAPLVYNPQTQVAQNTVVHLINTDLRKPNRTNVASKVPPGYVKPVVSNPVGSSSGSSSSSTSSKPGSNPPSLILAPLLPSSSTTSKPGPNVHIGFTSYEDKNKVPEEQKPQPPVVTYDQSCPTILINSYTRINNTIQSKDGCADLNIIINSHVFNTNVYKSTPSPLLGDTGSHQTYEEADKYVPGSQTDTNPILGYQPVPIYHTSSSGYPQLPQGGYYDPQKNPQGQVLQQNDVSSVEVIQDTQINISGSSLDESSQLSESSIAEDEEGGLANGGASSAGVPGVGSQVDDASSGNSLVRPAVAPAVSNTGSSATSPAPLAGLIASSSNPTRPTEDDDDDDYDLSPSGMMDSITSVFTYFTFVNPLHYGLFSLAAAPFTALAAGLLGIVTFLFPWLFPSSLGFSRSNNSEESFWSNLEGVVKEAMDKYGRVNEWKSKRKKRKR